MTKVGRNLASLPTIEYHLYIVVVVCGVGKSLLDAFYFVNELKQFYSPNDFAQGWSFLSRDKDIADPEWLIMSKLYVDFITWTTTYIIISQFLWWKMPWFIPNFYVIFASMSMIKVIGIIPTITLFFCALVMFVTSFYKKRLVCWITGMTLFLLVTNPETKLLAVIVDEYSFEHYVLFVVVGWLNIRSLSFCLHRCSEANSDRSVKRDLIRYLGFCFYFPLLYHGPLMMFADFEKQLFAAKPKRNLTFLTTWIADVIRFTFWGFLHEMVLHYFYIYALRSSPSLAETCSSLAPLGLLFAFHVSFHLKYILFYGMSSTIGQLEHFEPPAQPACVFMVCHRISNAWRYFDRGLYEFLKRYIYSPVLGESKRYVKKILASAITFLFVFVWHGNSYQIFRWSFLNYIEIVLEMLGVAFTTSKIYIKFEERWFSPIMARRLRVICFIPLIYWGLISNLYFIADNKLTDIIVDKLIFNASWPLFLLQSLIFYCLCNVTAEIENKKSESQGKESLNYKAKAS